MMMGRGFDSLALMAHAADVGFPALGDNAGGPGVAPASANAPEAPPADQRTNRRPRATRRMIFDSQAINEPWFAAPAAAAVAPATTDSAGADALLSQLESWVRAGASNGTQGRRAIARETIERVHAMNSTTLDLGQAGLDSLPDCLGLLTSVRTLELDGNLLTQLPAVLPPNLHIISMQNNRLGHFPANLPTSVAHADFSSNAIRSIPDSLHEGLVVLNVAANDVESLPASLPASLRHGRFDLNPISTIPEWVYDMHPSLHLQFSPGPLSASSLNAAWAHIAMSVGHPEHGPHLRLADFGRAFGNDGRAPLRVRPPSLRPAPRWHLQLNEQDELVSAAAGSAADGWRNRLGLEPNDNRARFIELIDRLPYTADYANPRLQKSFCMRVASLLRKLEADQAGRSLCFAIAADWHGTCEDGVALALDTMEMALYCAEVERGNLGSTELARVGGQMMRYEALERFTLALPGAQQMDLTEAALLLRTALMDDLDLPTNCQTMTYAAFAERSCMIDKSTIDAARAQVKSETGGDALVDYLANWQPWITRLKIDHPERAAEVARSNQELKLALTQQMEALDDGKVDMSSGEYDRAAKALVVRYDAIDGFDPETRRALTIESIRSIESTMASGSLRPTSDAAKEST